MIRTHWMIVRHSLARHALSTAVTVLSAALASGLVLAVFSLSEQSTRAFAGGRFGFDAVLGARGSTLQLVLNTIYHLETSPGNIPWSLYERVRADPRVRRAVPYAVGDSYRGRRVVGTTPELFEVEVQEGRPYRIPAPGRVFDPSYREAVIGATAARELGLALNDRFQPAHGVLDGPGARVHDELYTVVGILEPTNTPSDGVIWIPIDGIYHMEGHVGRDEQGHAVDATHEEGVPPEFREVSAVLLALSSGQAGFSLSNEINRERRDATLAWPIAEPMANLIRKLGWVNRVLEVVAYLVVAVTAGSLLASLYNTMNERRREFAVLRALGARKRTVFGVIVLEAGTIAGMGAVLGYLVHYAILFGVAGVVRDRTGVVLDTSLVHPSFFWTPVAMVAVGAVSGLLPAFKAYSTDVASTLAGS